MAHKINKFGTIFEDEDGNIHLDSFSIDCGGNEFSPEEALRAVIKRLEEELKQVVPFKVNRLN